MSSPVGEVRIGDNFVNAAWLSLAFGERATFSCVAKRK